MTILQAAIELSLFTIFLTIITLICVLCQVAIGDAFFTLLLAGISYALTTYKRDDPNNFKDKHL